MSSQQGRYAGARPPAVAEGWHLQRLTPVSRLFGANGVRTGPDGRLYVAQVAGSQISAIDVTSGEIEAISPMGGQIVGPDDLPAHRADRLDLATGHVDGADLAAGDLGDVEAAVRSRAHAIGTEQPADRGQPLQMPSFGHGRGACAGITPLLR